MHTVYLLTGSNIGDREAQLEQARMMITARCGEVTDASAPFETAPWGEEEQPLFLNQALQLQTFSGPHALLHCLLEIEKAMGRVRHEKWGPRTIDIDLLFYDDAIVDTPELVIPHPQVHNRRFALAPLAQIAGGLIHPVLQKNITQLLRECPDTLQVYKFTHDFGKG